MARIFIKNTGIGLSVDTASQPSYELYPQIRETLLKDLGLEYAAYFAEPVVDLRSNEIDWYADNADGDVELLAYADLVPDDQKRWDQQAVDILAAIRELGERYVLSGISGQQAIGRALLAAASDSAPEDRYLLGDQPVVTFWGFKHHEAVAVHSRLPDELAVVDPIDAITEDRGRVSECAELLSPLLFAARLLWGLTLLAGLVTVALVVARFTGVWPVDQAGIIQAPRTAEDAALVADIAAALSQEDALRAELNGLHERELEQACACRLQQAVGRSKPPVETAPAPEEDLVVPDGAAEQRDLSFLRGKWRSYSGLKSTSDGKPIILEYEFGADGRGTSRIYETNPDMVCSAPVVAVFDDAGQLLINDQENLICDNGSSAYNRSKVTCTIADNGRAECRGKQEDNSYSVRIRRKE